jgi:hypothetical protein
MKLLNQFAQPGSVGWTRSGAGMRMCGQRASAAAAAWTPCTTATGLRHIPLAAVSPGGLHLVNRQRSVWRVHALPPAAITAAAAAAVPSLVPGFMFNVLDQFNVRGGGLAWLAVLEALAGTSAHNHLLHRVWAI